MFNTLIVQPVFNLLVVIYAILPGHDFGVTIILFTILVRLLMWPLIKKQLHHAKAMRDLQPELRRIKKETKGNRQKESLMVMELYKERQINPFASLGLLILQIPVLIALYSGLNKIINDPQSITTFTYSFVQHLPWVEHLAQNIGDFNTTFLGLVDLKRAALPSGGPLYIPALLIVAASALAQYYQTKQLLPDDKEAKGLRQILKDAGKGKQTDNGDVNVAIGRNMRFFVPVMVFIFTIGLPSALSLYWLTTGLVAIFQQSRVLNKDKVEMVKIAEDKTTGKAIEGEIIPPKKKASKSGKGNKGNKAGKKRRKK